MRHYIFAPILIFTFCLSFVGKSNASPTQASFGAQISYAAVAKEPPHLNGYQIMLTYDPKRFVWNRVNILFDGGYSHFWDNTANANSNISIYSVAPIIRYTFKRKGPVLPYFEFSIGLAYLNHTHIEKRNLGIHFAFQDRMGIGALFGASENLSIGIHAVHYSNARLSEHNSGLTVPLVLDIGYKLT